MGIFKKKADEKKSVDANAFRKEIREYWYENPQLVDQFIAQRGNDLTEEQKNILLSWKHAIHGQFICLKYYKNYAIFGSAKEDSTQYYAVLGIFDDFNELLPFDPPYLINVGIMPYKNVIIWDGLIQHYPVIMGSNIKKSFNDEYQKCKREKKIITNLL